MFPRFMISCDTCGEWYHGSCIGVTRKMAQNLDKRKQPWECFKCIGIGRFLDKIRVFKVHSHLRFIRRESLRELFVKQECILVGCVSSAAVAVAGRGCLPGGVCPWGRRCLNRITDRCKTLHGNNGTFTWIEKCNNGLCTHFL